MELNMQISQEYVSGMTFEKEAIRKLKYTCKSENPELDGLVFWSETITKKHAGLYGKWGVGKTIYYLFYSRSEFKSIGKLCEFHLKRKAKTNTS